MKQNLYDQLDFCQDYQKLLLSDESENDIIEQPAFRGCLPSLKGLRVLDLGCGGGQFAKNARRTPLAAASDFRGKKTYVYYFQDAEDFEMNEQKPGGVIRAFLQGHYVSVSI
ncbi:hypothetical protein [Brevibacillus sp. BC25]|uniref:hypothetical protein n=1 Tax=Brevibacillus sp. BC25 TaxID=1144308 RepID=UPI000270F4BC|nr:hypothetical protein [Brevibacillus sp. BC25]EJL26668.1 hypothetical protein PMI05_03110 [Brevibacillus sp. BC25]